MEQVGLLHQQLLMLEDGVQHHLVLKQQHYFLEELQEDLHYQRQSHIMELHGPQLVQWELQDTIMVVVEHKL
jgi:hypothetical protein